MKVKLRKKHQIIEIGQMTSFEIQIGFNFFCLSFWGILFVIFVSAINDLNPQAFFSIGQIECCDVTMTWTYLYTMCE